MSVWQAWNDAAAAYTGCRVVALIPGFGLFDMRHGEVYRVFEGSRNRLGTARRITSGEIAELDWAAAHGCLQIEVRPVTGIIGGQCGGGVASAETQTIVIFQARGYIDDCNVPLSC